MTKRKTTKQFIDEAKRIHGNLYSYDNVIYVNNATKVDIKCEKHGYFKQSPSAHINQKSKCPKCYDKNKKKTTDSFITECLDVHGTKFSYEKVVYVNNKIKVIINCPKHGDFLQLPPIHLQGQGCSNCYGNRKITKDEFYKKVNDLFDFKYTYFDDYKNIREYIKIECPIHGVYEQLAQSHYNGHQCQKCAKVGYDKEKDSLFYIQQISNKNNKIISYKFGITNKTAIERTKKQSSGTKYDVKTIYEYSNSGTFIFELEKKIKSMLKTSYLKKSEFSDGFTETISPNDYDFLKECVKNIIFDGTDDV